LFCDRQVRDIGWPAAPDLWVQSSLKRRQRFPQLLFPDGMRSTETAVFGLRKTFGLAWA
jgi:hypothetical protein